MENIDENKFLNALNREQESPSNKSTTRLVDGNGIEQFDPDFTTFKRSNISYRILFVTIGKPVAYHYKGKYEKCLKPFFCKYCDKKEVINQYYPGKIIILRDSRNVNDQATLNKEIGWKIPKSVHKQITKLMENDGLTFPVEVNIKVTGARNQYKYDVRSARNNKKTIDFLEKLGTILKETKQ